MNWIIKTFQELTSQELYNVLQLRTEVFVVEQNCVFQDMDNKDSKCYHLMCMENEELVAYTRLVPAGVSFSEVSIGRVVSSPSVRGRGFGKMLMEKSIEESNRLFGKQSIRIGAQFYLLDFYKSFGFLPDGEIYLEDDIEHIEMILHRPTQ